MSAAVLEQGPSVYYPGETRAKCPACGKFELKPGAIMCAACSCHVCPECHAVMNWKGWGNSAESSSDLYQCPACKNVELG
jgi:hypothetical protein